MSGVPIPDDWDGETWQCLSVEWPSSEKWTAILLGQLSRPRLARTWDAQSGSVILAQQTGIEIWLNNLDLEECLLACNDEFLAMFADLVTAVSSMSAGGGCGCAGGTGVPTTNGEEGGSPPPGFGDTTETSGSPEYFTRKCKIANIIHANVKDLVQKLIDNGVDTLLNSLGRAAIPVATTLITAALAEFVTPFPIVDALAGAVIGFLFGIAIVFIDETIGLASMLTKLETDEETYICALVEATDGIEARIDYVAAANAVGMSLGNQALLSAILVVDYLNALFFAPEGSGAALEASLTGYTPPISCDPCSYCPNPVIVSFGTLIDEGEGFTELAATFQSTYYAVRIDMTADQTCFQECTGVTILSGSVTPHAFWAPVAWWWWDDVLDQIPETTQAALIGKCTAGLMIASSTDFSVRFEYQDCP